MGTDKTTGKSKKHMGTPAYIGSLVVIGVVVTTGAVLIGKSDNGQINVAATIQNSNQANIEAGGNELENVGIIPETFRNLPNGGLVAQENQENNTPPPVVSPEEVEVTTEGDASASTTGAPADGPTEATP